MHENNEYNVPIFVPYEEVKDLKKDLKASLDDMAQILGCRVPICKNREEAKKGSCAYIIKNKGLLASGRNADEAETALKVLKKAVLVELQGRNLGGTKPVNKLTAKLEHKFYMNKYSKRNLTKSVEQKPEEFSQTELERRQTIIDYGKKLVRDQLIQGTWGNISMRLDENYFLITPSGMDYEKLNAADICKVRLSDGTNLGVHKPSSEKDMHAYIYNSREDVLAIIHTHSTNCVTFAACEKDLKGKGIDFPCAKYGISGSKKLAKNSVKALSKGNGCLLAHHGVVCVGKEMEDVYALCVDAEIKAGEIINEKI